MSDLKRFFCAFFCHCLAWYSSPSIFTRDHSTTERLASPQCISTRDEHADFSSQKSVFLRFVPALKKAPSSRTGFRIPEKFFTHFCMRCTSVSAIRLLPKCTH